MKWTLKRRKERSILAKAKGYGKWMVGKKHSDKTKKKLSLLRKGKPFSGKKCDWNGRRHSEESKIKISLAKKGWKMSKGHKEKLSGKNSRFWKGGISNDRKQYYRFKCLERVARKKKALGTHTLIEWEELKLRHNYTCLHCLKKQPDIVLTQDHIIPLSKGGTDFINNIQPLCLSCNSRKGNRNNSPCAEIEFI